MSAANKTNPDQLRHIKVMELAKRIFNIQRGSQPWGSFEKQTHKEKEYWCAVAQVCSRNKDSFFFNYLKEPS